MKKFCVLFGLGLFLYISLCFFSACSNDCNPNPVDPRLVSISGSFKKIKGITADNYFIIDSLTNSSNGISYDSLGLDILNKFDSYSVNYDLGFSTAAYACEPALNFSKIDSVILSSSEDYDDIHKKGTNLMDISNIRKGYNVQASPIYEVYNQNFFINFKSAPSESKIHIFKLRLKLLDGRYITFTFPSIKLNK